MNNKFKTVVLSLKTATERREHITNLLNNIGLDFDFFDAISGDEITQEIEDKYFKYVDYYHYDVNQKGLMAIFMSHLEILKYSFTNETNLLILEDDVDYIGGLDFDAIDFDTFDLYNLCSPNGLPMVGSHAQLVSFQGAKKIYDHLMTTKITQGYDWELIKIKSIKTVFSDIHYFPQLSEQFESQLAPNGHVLKKLDKGNKIGCYKPWSSLYFENSTNESGPCCWVTGGYGKLKNDSNLDDVWATDTWEKLRRDMYDANGELPTQCRLYCNGKQEHTSASYERAIYEWSQNQNKWSMPPYEVALTVANACNLKCKLCWIFDDFDYVIPMEGAERVIEQVRTHENSDTGLMTTINLSGGEIFYAKPMRKLVYDLVNDDDCGKGFTLSFISNATVFDEKWWDIIKDKPRALNICNISIDGWDRESYMNYRGKDVFDTVTKNVDKIIKWRNENMHSHGHLIIYINSLIMTKTYPHLKEIIDLWWDKEVELLFIPLIIGYKADDQEQVYNNPVLRLACRDKISEALEYLETKEVTNDFKNRNKMSMKRTLNDNLNYVNSLINGYNKR